MKEYKVLKISSIGSSAAARLTEAMNKLAEEGWTLKTMSCDSTVIFAAFERDKQE